MELLPVDLPLPVLASRRRALVLDRVLLDAREASEDRVCDPEPRPGWPRERPNLGAVSNVTVSGGTRRASSGCRGDF